MGKKFLLLIPILIACLLLILLICYFGFLRKNYEPEIQERMKEFLIDNPNSTESYARDVVIHDLAIEEKDSSLCEKIITNWLKEDCLNFFKVNE
ncbi:MAG: hypothetical protein QXS48_00215 [Candidatus Aenigmatarchaeota archaeon]